MSDVTEVKVEHRFLKKYYLCLTLCVIVVSIYCFHFFDTPSFC